MKFSRHKFTYEDDLRLRRMMIIIIIIIMTYQMTYD